MESFEVQLLEDRFKIEPHENGLYRIMEGDHKLGVIFQEAEGMQLTVSPMEDGVYRVCDKSFG